MVKEGYKEVRVGPQKETIPHNWNVKALSDIGEFINGKGFSSSDWKEDGLPIVRIQNLNDEEAEYNYYSGDVKDRYYLENGDILLSWSASLGAYKWNRGEALLNQHIFKVLPKDNINKEFMYQLLLVTIDKLEQKTHGSTMKHIRRKELDLTYFPLPPLSEQKKIASILSSVDESIEKTDEIIEKTKELKKGLMQELLTKGIGHTEFKEVKVPLLPVKWKLPKGWDIKFLKDLTTKITDGAHQTPTYVDEGVPFLRVTDIQDYEIDWESTKRIPKEEHIKLTKRCKPERGDILLSKNGTIGITKIIDWDKEFSNFVSLCLIKPDKEVIYNKYLSIILGSEFCLQQAAIGSKTGTVTNLHLTEIRKFNIPVPPIEEQKKIASILSSVDNKIEKEEEYKVKLERLKKGLMQKLLTGEIRVNTDMEV